MIHLSLTEQEADLVSYILQWWTDDYNAATNDVINDRTLETPEQLLEAVSGMHETFAVTQSIMEKLNDGRAPSAV